MSVRVEHGRSRQWLRSHRWLLLRRVSQLSVLGLFLLGPVLGIWVVKGNLSSSVLLDTVPMSDPLLFMQSVASGHVPELTLIVGVALVVLFYGLLGGRTFCSWVCPLNMVTDSAHWLRRRFGWRKSRKLSRATRWWLLAMAILAPAATGFMVWELINPVSVLHRGIIFGMGLGWLLIAAVFLFDLLYAQRGFCGHICPQGALYGLIGRFSPLRVSARHRQRCDDCMDCYAVCPEPQVLKPVLKGAARGQGPAISGYDCTRCGRCIDVCTKDVFQFDFHLANQAEGSP